MNSYTPTSLVTAVTQLFQLNNYHVSGPTKVHGAEVDLVATPLADPFGRRIYIEVTIEYVDNEKYGKDVGKLAMLGELDRDAQRLIVSSSGFSLPVQERARQTRIETLTYDALFQRFEKFEPYVNAFSPETDVGSALEALTSVYEPPQFDDGSGTEFAIDFLTTWKDSPVPEQRWIVVTGEYGTGKTALTKVLHYKWLNSYKLNPTHPIPFRIELRSFVRQFDARGLLHHFLDRNRLSHIPVDFVESLVRSGRVVLLLDGYDEMAQFFSSRERRQCLEALATLSSDGAKGIITSRPNYFTLSEELQVFEALYSSIRATHHLNASAQAFFDQEKNVDRLLEKFLDRFERHLRDLTPEQTNALVERILDGDPQGLSTIKQILAKIFRNKNGDSTSLSGKPVIVSYLLEVVEQLKQIPIADRELDTQLSEWQVYRLIVDQLMLRDLERSPDVTPDTRRLFLQRLAVFLSRKENDCIFEEDFRDLVAAEFKRDLNRYTGESRIEAQSRFFSDMRSSATLTRSSTPSREGWRFSHNSIREFLITEYIVSKLLVGGYVNERVPISDAMQTFAAAIPIANIGRLFSALQAVWSQAEFNGAGKGQVLCLLWDAFLTLFPTDGDRPRAVLSVISKIGRGLRDVMVSRLNFSTNGNPSDLSNLSFEGATLSFVKLECADLSGCDFTDCVLDSVSLSDANLSGANLSGALLMDVTLIGTNLTGCRCVRLDPDTICLIVDDFALARPVRIEGRYAIGYLRFHGAITDPIPDYFVYAHHPRFDIVSKIVINLSKESQRQRRGLEQRGAAHADVPFARDFVSFLLKHGLISVPRGRSDLVEVTADGRRVFSDFVDGEVLDPVLASFFQAA